MQALRENTSTAEWGTAPVPKRSGRLESTPAQCAGRLELQCFAWKSTLGDLFLGAWDLIYTVSCSHARKVAAAETALVNTDTGTRAVSKDRRSAPRLSTGAPARDGQRALRPQGAN